MDLANLTSIATVGRSATAVGTALAPRPAVTKAAPKDSTSTGAASGDGASTGSSDITADDFLTLLVSELKNQDPTQPTDPNQYITQLAQVNSLQQLIAINQGIGTLDNSVTGTGSSSGPGDGSNANVVSSLGN